ncbi:uncharacterized protein F4822DRAFT_402841 [Hypoxylon trugodes]|uniref:uncharacterized protein n=1 Tax=Hypoxylon trugodes TaxID=326681 RepID=UPI00219D2C10|nr:uncharacterized protein F4822DRAFT_402841 [Hypoxylon trugodes]KAI1388440.1 hypothetical protein F4822DRAFT_402841 [Hypoxylon trugodes]
MPRSSVSGPSSSCNPAPYGQACLGCSRAKCKCFQRADGSACERCHRLGKTCEPAMAVRKRKAATPPPAPEQPKQPLPSMVSSRLEEKLDDLVTLLRSQAAEKQGPTRIQTHRQTPQSTPEGHIGQYGNSTSPPPSHEHPDLVLDTAASVVHLVRPTSPPISPSLILDDVSVHKLPNEIADEQLNLFRHLFVSMFPLIHIPATLSAAELRHQKPFLWLVIMALTTKMVSQQFAMEETIWEIVSRRIMCQHLVDLDLILGVICFASWSHYFKKDKPFMSKLSQLAVSLAFELGIHHDVPAISPRRHQFPVQKAPRQHPRTMEERRTMLAVFHLTSSTWSTYRQTEPLRWTPYLSDCLRILGEGRGTSLDILLVTQIKCQIITNQLTCSQVDEIAGVEGPKVPSAALTTTLLRQVNDIRQNLPAQIRSHRSTEFYMSYTELKVRESALGRPRPQDQTGLSQIQRLQDLESLMNNIENWITVYSETPISQWVSFTSDITTQFMQYVVVLFKLNTLDEPGWDLQEVRRRADVFEILDHTCEQLNRLPTLVGMIDADGPRRGFFFKMIRLLRDIKGLLLAEMPPNAPSDATAAAAFPTPESADANGAGEFMDFSFTDEFLMGMLQEDISAPVWDFRPDGTCMSFGT